MKTLLILFLIFVSFLKGADIVIGAHPHVVQPSFWDKKNDTYVAYSLGNFMVQNCRRS